MKNETHLFKLEISIKRFDPFLFNLEKPIKVFRYYRYFCNVHLNNLNF